MATINCPHCGKEIFDELLECPSCHGPIEQNVENAIDEMLMERNKSEKLAFIACAVIAGMLALTLGLASLTSPSGSLLTLILIVIVEFPVMTCVCYGMRWAYNKMKDTSIWEYMSIPIIGWIIGLYIIIFVGIVAGVIVGPLAIINLIKKKPIISREKLLKELSN